MLDFAKICKQCEKLGVAERGLMIAEKAAVVLAKVRLLDIPELDPVETLATFIVGAIVSDGKINEHEYLMLYPSLVAAFGEDFDFETIKHSFEDDKKGIAELKQCSKDLLTIIGFLDEDLQADVVALCLLVVSVDGKVSLREKNYIKQLCKC